MRTVLRPMPRQTAWLTTIVVSWEEKLNADRDSRSQVRGNEGHLLFKSPEGKLTKNNKGSTQAKRGSEPLFLAPPEAWTGRARYNQSQIHDRTCDGAGYTRDELDKLYINDLNHGMREFCHWSGRDSYLADQSTWLVEEVDLTPALEPTRHKDFHIEGCVREMDELRSQVETYRSQLLAHIDTLKEEISEHLWITPDFAEPAAENLNRTRNEVDTLLGRVERLREGFCSLPREVRPHERKDAPEKKNRTKRGR